MAASKIPVGSRSHIRCLAKVLGSPGFDPRLCFLQELPSSTSLLWDGHGKVKSLCWEHLRLQFLEFTPGIASYQPFLAQNSPSPGPHCSPPPQNAPQTPNFTWFFPQKSHSFYLDGFGVLAWIRKLPQIWVSHRSHSSW